MTDRADIAHERIQEANEAIREYAHEVMPVMASMADRARALLAESRRRKAEAVAVQEEA